MENNSIFRQGIKDGVPIGLGYFAVSFGLGIAAQKAGISAFQGFLLSAFNNASAGEYAAIESIRQNAPYFELALLILVANARYLLMSCAMSQRVSPALSLPKRILMGFYITDEIFGIAMASEPPIKPKYLYGAYLMAFPAWAFGTSFGIIAGNILPTDIVTALSAAIYGMFIAIIIPPGKKDRTLLILIIVSFIISTLCAYLPVVSSLSSNIRIIILTLVISSIAAILKPIPLPEDEGEVA